jgi:CheY-like chemotaxis protein
MPPADDDIDLELLVRAAISGVAVKAHARGINLSAHIDNRLNNRALGDGAALAGYLRRGLARTVTAGRTGQIALGLWRGEANREIGEPPILLEVCRAVDRAEMPQSRLAALWTPPTGGGKARLAVARQSDGAERVLIALPCEPVPDAPQIVQKWGGSFRGRYILHVGKVLYDRERFRASLAAASLEVNLITSPAKALEQARSRADKGQSVDFLLIDGNRLDDGAIALARDFRADPRLAGARIVLTGVTPGLELSSDDAALFDALQRRSMPWRRLMDVLHGVARGPAEGSAPQPAAGDSRSAIPSLAGRRILIAEDVATNQVLLKAVLAPTGAEVELVADGAAVLERHAQAPADLILMDLQMPGIGGIAAMRRLRRLGGAAGAVPVVALTAYARRADRQMALGAGMDAYLAKPIAVSELYDLLRRLLPEDGTGTD